MTVPFCAIELLERTPNKNGERKKILRLPLPANGVQQLQQLQRVALAATSQPPITMMQTTVHQSGAGGVTLPVQSGSGAAASLLRMPKPAVLYTYKGEHQFFSVPQQIFFKIYQ